MKIVRALLAALAALAIAVGVQAATSSGAGAACGNCWEVVGQG